MSKSEADDKKLAEWLDERDAVFSNPTIETALAWWFKNNLPPAMDETVPLAAIHKGRLQWLEATDTMLAESKIWLEVNHYQHTMQGAPPLTPETRDAQRVMLGKKPLGEMKNDDE